MHPFHESPWYRQIVARMYTLWPLKALGTAAFMMLFFWAYFAVLRNPLFPVTVMPLTWLDTAIPVTSLAFPFYASLWVYASLPIAFMKDMRAMLRFGVWMAAMCLLCLGIFWLLPTGVPAAGVDWRLYPEMAVIKDVDTGGNACPSLHVASAVFAAVWLARIFEHVGAPAAVRWLNWLQCLAILWSTVATRQHVVFDVLAGATVGVLFGVAGLRHTLQHAPAQEI
ncbi:MAG TPA: phosphatase PAP2 family protein [Azonexus sp.]|nr:phosphatase PAP2 family protein [Azonexus sp.]